MLTKEIGSGTLKASSIVIGIVVASFIYGIAAIINEGLAGFSAAGESESTMYYVAPITVIFIALLFIAMGKTKIFPFVLIIWSIFLHIIWIYY